MRPRRFGVRTGTPVWEARKLCPSITCVIADHKRYVAMHNRIVDAVGSVVPMQHIMSIDEMTCRLMGDERQEDARLRPQRVSRPPSRNRPVTT